MKINIKKEEKIEEETIEKDPQDVLNAMSTQGALNTVSSLDNFTKNDLENEFSYNDTSIVEEQNIQETTTISEEVVDSNNIKENKNPLQSLLNKFKS